MSRKTKPSPAFPNSYPTSAAPISPPNGQPTKPTQACRADSFDVRGVPSRARYAGEAKNVIYAVYQDRTGPAAQANPKIILFIGGNLTGT